MKKIFTNVFIVLFLISSLSGCGIVGEKSTNLSAIYAIIAVISLLLLMGCVYFVREKRGWFLLLFSSVFVVNTGYTILSLSTSLEMALWANRIAYLGSVFLPLSMLMIILNETNTSYKKRVPNILLLIALLIFLIAASPGILPFYYKEVSFAIVNGVSTLVKDYGPLHPIYLVYLLGYFTAMVIVIVLAKRKKTIDTTSHAIILAVAVFVNIGVWFIEQIVRIDFEILSISYIISELFLLGIHLIINDNHHLREIIKQVESIQSYALEETNTANIMLEKPVKTNAIVLEQIEIFIKGLEQLTPTEKAIYEAHLARVTSKEIMASMNIKESTLKFHNRNLYGKLGVSTRKELLEVHKYLKSVKTQLASSDNNTLK